MTDERNNYDQKQTKNKNPKKPNQTKKTDKKNKNLVSHADSPWIIIDRKVRKDIRDAAQFLGSDEVRYLVSTYYEMQDNRIRSDHQLRGLEATSKPSDGIAMIAELSRQMENTIKGALDRYSSTHPHGAWLRAQVGIGPVIAAGFLAHIDIERSVTVGKLWAFAGQDPTKEWKKGERRPWNADLKCLCWKAGESFVKQSGRDGCYYGQVYVERKKFEVARNEAGLLADQAAAILEKRKFRKETDAYKAYSSGKLPPAHIHARARRYAVKLFLAHLHDDLHRQVLGTAPALPYAITCGMMPEHKHVIPRPTPGENFDRDKIRALQDFAQNKLGMSLEEAQQAMADGTVKFEE
jgi:hypothetical protein